MTCNCLRIVPATNGYDFATSVVVACVISACVVLGYFVYRIETAKPAPPSS